MKVRKKYTLGSLFERIDNMMAEAGCKPDILEQSCPGRQEEIRSDLWEPFYTVHFRKDGLRLNLFLEGDITGLAEPQERNLYRIGSYFISSGSADSYRKLSAYGAECALALRSIRLKEDDFVWYGYSVRCFSGTESIGTPGLFTTLDDARKHAEKETDGISASWALIRRNSDGQCENYGVNNKIDACRYMLTSRGYEPAEVKEVLDGVSEQMLEYLKPKDILDKAREMRGRN